GFAKPDGPALCMELERRVEESDMADPEVTLADPDTLVLSSAKTEGDYSPPSGLGLAFLGGPPFQGLVAELRFRVSARCRRRGRVIGVLVIIGELCDNGILVKAVWQSGLTGQQDANSWLASTPQEELLLNGLAEFRTSGEVAPGLARGVFRRAAGARFGKCVVKAVAVPFGRDRFPGLLLRVAGFTFGTIASCWLIDLLIEHKFWFPLVLLGLLLFIPAMLLGFFVLLEGVYLVGGYRTTQRTFVSYYEEEGFVPLSAYEAATRHADPLSRKYLAELSAAGFVLIGGVGVLTRGECGSLHRVFAAPDGITYLVLICYSHVARNTDLKVHFWPQFVALKAYSFLTGGSRIESASAMSYGFWKQRVGPNTLIRFVRDVEDPIEFSRNHAAEAAAFATEQGLTPARHERFEDFFRRQAAIHEEQRQQYLDRSFTWSDHLRWYLQWPRKEFRG
ncbi:MAG TPA: hypothetical protein VG122_26140, partial [Gemmata sp.]|nr:hypothetical protein [Gemmata sp.]